jgi:hypothetical protein
MCCASAVASPVRYFRSGAGSGPAAAATHARARRAPSSKEKPLGVLEGGLAPVGDDLAVLRLQGTGLRVDFVIVVFLALAIAHSLGRGQADRSDGNPPRPAAVAYKEVAIAQ